MERLKNKSRKVRVFVYERIRLTILKSSKLYCLYVKARKQKDKANFTLKCSDKLNHRIKRRLRQYLSLFTCNKLTKTRRHAANYCEFKLSRDIEKNLNSRSYSSVY